MKEKDKFRYAEKCLYGYKRNMACLKVLRDDLRVEEAGTDVHAQNYQYTFGFSGEPSNPVEARQMKIESLQGRIRTLERWTKPITELIGDLTSPDVLNGSNNAAMMEVLRLMYFGGNLPDVIIEELRIARRTFYRIRRELVCVTIMYLAL
ncbi:MAG: hypothetical protein II877_04010 [Synergistaceae bacterium]|nr:hypothetical protein [Synergistaceae bacterium]